MLVDLVQSGDPRSQLLFGMMLIEGKQVPQDMALGLAYVKMAAASQNPTFGKLIGEHARAAVTQYELRLPGSEIIKAEQLAARMTQEKDAKDVIALQPALTPYTTEKLVKAHPIVFSTEPVQLSVPPVAASKQLVRLGCAAENSGGCSTAPKPGTAGHCTGRLSRVDYDAAMNGANTLIVLPDFPLALRRQRHRLDATVGVLAHIDSSGWVCSAIVTQSGGDARLDASALEAVRQWKFLPAEKAGAPIESLKHFTVSFRQN